MRMIASLRNGALIAGKCVGRVSLIAGRRLVLWRVLWLHASSIYWGSCGAYKCFKLLPSSTASLHLSAHMSYAIYNEKSARRDANTARWP